MYEVTGELPVAGATRLVQVNCTFVSDVVDPLARMGAALDTVSTRAPVEITPLLAVPVPLALVAETLTYTKVFKAKP